MSDREHPELIAEIGDHVHAVVYVPNRLEVYGEVTSVDESPSRGGIQYTIQPDDQSHAVCAFNGELRKVNKRTNKTLSSSIYVVEVQNREDGIYAFSSDGEADRFVDAVNENGGDADVIEVPLNLSPDHTDDLIESESVPEGEL